jgi:hypothetical protein
MLIDRNGRALSPCRIAAALKNALFVPYRSRKAYKSAVGRYFEGLLQ